MSLAPVLPAAESTGGPAWLVANGFHTSVALRARDVPFRRELTSEPADCLVIGWGAADCYRGHVNPWALTKAIVSDKSIIHVVPVRGTLAKRFPHSDVVRLRLSGAQMRALVRQIDDYFARDAQNRRIPLGQGYYPESRFFAGRARFYFPNMCNLALAVSFRRSGVPFIPAGAIFSPGLIRQAGQMGVWEQHRSRPADAF